MVQFSHQFPAFLRGGLQGVLSSRQFLLERSDLGFHLKNTNFNGETYHEHLVRNILPYVEDYYYETGISMTFFDEFEVDLFFAKILNHERSVYILQI